MSPEEYAAAFQAGRESVLEEQRQGNDDAARDLEHDDSEWAEEMRRRSMPGCNADDTTDSRGRPLRPTRNDAGEYWWM